MLLNSDNVMCIEGITRLPTSPTCSTNVLTIFIHDVLQCRKVSSQWVPHQSDGQKPSFVNGTQFDTTAMILTGKSGVCESHHHRQ
jgi:hypothetical protein